MDVSSFFDDPAPPQPPPAPQPQPWAGPPGNVLGAAVPLDVLLVRTDHAAVVLGNVVAYPEGFAFVVRAHLRKPIRSPLDHRLNDALLFGVEFADGRRAGTDRLPFGASEPLAPPVLVPGGGGGGASAWHWDFWLWGLPAPGTLAFVCAWPPQAVPETRVEVDAAPILAAATRAQELWPDAGPGGGRHVGSTWQIMTALGPDPEDD
jgi:hypothetical protein